MAEYRTIAPSAHGEHSSSSGNGSGASRRRRVTGQVSQLACNECRRTRSKCDGDRPRRCSRCAARGLTCVYEPHTKTQKGDLLRELNSARAREQELRSESSNASIILDIIARDGHVDEIIRRLRSGSPQKSVVEWLLSLEDVKPFLKSSLSSSEPWIEAVRRVECFFATSDDDDLLAPQVLPTRWTTVTTNQALLKHMFELYFTWVHPLHMLFSELAFLDCFSRGDRTHCSPALVNAICAMACSLWESPEPSSPKTPTAQLGSFQLEHEDVGKLQEAFIKEAKSSLDPRERPDLVIIQALGILSLVHFSCGQARYAMSYLRCAVDNIEPRDESQIVDPVHESIVDISRWGIQSLNTVWSGLTYQRPFTSELLDAEIIFSSAQESRWWHDYRYRGDDKNLPRRPGFAILTAKYQARLFRVVHTFLNMYGGGQEKIRAKAFIDVYRSLVSWKVFLPQELRMREGGDLLPHVCSLNVLYHTAVVHLLSPLISCHHFPDNGDRDEILDLVVSAARRGLEIVQYLHEANLSRYTMPVVAFSLCHLGHSMMRYSADELEKTKIAGLCLDVLHQNRVGFAVCGPLLQVFQNAMQDYGVELSGDSAHQYDLPTKYGIDEILDSCTRLSYAQPTESMARWIHEDLSREWHDAWSSFKHEEPVNPRSSMHLRNLLNT